MLNFTRSFKSIRSRKKMVAKFFKSEETDLLIHFLSHFLYIRGRLSLRHALILQPKQKVHKRYENTPDKCKMIFECEVFKQDFR